MFSVVVCSVLISSVLGGPVLYGGSIPIHLPVGVVGHAPAAVVPLPLVHSIRSQFHSQDELGQYSYGYSNEHSSKVETKDFTGLTSGGYSYIDANGLVQNINYIADDANGFRVAASNLPVAHYPIPHGAPVYPAAVPLPGLPEPVSDTPEVQKAKEEHEKAKAEAEKAVAAAAAAAAEHSSEESQSTENSSSEESTETAEGNAEGETKPYPQAGPETAVGTSPAPPVSSTEKTDSGSSSQSDEGSSSVEFPTGEVAPQVPEVTLDGAQIRSYLGNPLFRAGPPYLTYLPGAYVALSKRETPAAYSPAISAEDIQKFLAASDKVWSTSAKSFSKRTNVDTNVVSKR